MADEKKEKKPAAKSAASKSAAPKAAKAAKEVSAKAEPAGPACRVEKCKQTARAKGYCRKHYMGWRRGKVGKKHRYDICSKEGCRKPTLLGGKCLEHKKGAAAAAPAAA